MNKYSAEQLQKCFMFCYSYPLTSSVFLFSHPHSLCMLLAEDGDDRTRWLFNRFVLGSTMGGGIVVNIITYRSLPCQTGPITHGSQPLPPPSLPSACIPFSFQRDSVCLHHLTLSKPLTSKYSASF